MASEPVHISEVLDAPLVGCPACGGVGTGEVDERVVECSYCESGLVTLAAYNAWEEAHPWGFLPKN